MIGQTVLHYKILEKLGEGGMGVVYKAEDTKLRRQVAIKFLPDRVNKDTAAKERFLQEAQAAAALNHPNICTIHGVEEVDGSLFIVMEYVEGGTLREKLPFAKIDAAITIAAQIGEALQEAHSKGIVHRDIKADNIMLTSKGQAKVMDFGLAKLKGALKLTKTSSTVGTLGYMAPEQIQGGEVDHRSDIFSFGVLLFEMLTGKLPFRGEHEAAMMYSILNEQPEPIEKYLPEASSEFLHIFNRALEKDPEDRYQSVHDMVIDLRRLKKGTSRVSYVSRTEVLASNKPATSSAPLQIQTRKHFRHWMIALGGCAAVIVVIVAGYSLFLSGQKPIDSIAVLPFVNVGADPNTEYLSDGLTENIINNLTKVPRLHVVPRSTVFHHKGVDLDPLKVGRELKVRAVLTGKLTKRDDKFNIQTELIDIDEESQIWGEQFNQSVSEMLSFQQDLSKQIVQKLRLRLSGEEEKRFAKRPTENTEAFQLYLKGQFYWNKRTRDDLLKAIDYFVQAREKDPNYALAYAGLALTYAVLDDYGFPSKETVPKAEAAARRALEIDETIAGPHAVLGLIKACYEWDWAGSEREFKRAIELDPDYPTAHHWYAYTLACQRRLDEALREINLAQELDPLSRVIAVYRANILVCLRRFDDAIGQYKKVLELDSNFAGAHLGLGFAYRSKGMYGEAIGEQQRGRALVSTGPQGLGSLGRSYAVAGKKAEARNILDKLLENSRRGQSVTLDIANVYAALDDKDLALQWLERAYNERNTSLALVNVDPDWESFRSEPRFTNLLKKMGLAK